jgi:hypothetical protein
VINIVLCRRSGAVCRVPIHHCHPVPGSSDWTPLMQAACQGQHTDVTVKDVYASYTVAVVSETPGLQEPLCHLLLVMSSQNP